MQNKLHEILHKANFWKSISIDLGSKRDQYLDQLEKLLDNNLIKVLTGQRRVGKSYILKQFIERLIEKRNINPLNILYINFENNDFSFVKNKDDLSELISFYFDVINYDKSQKIYFIFDEIQEVQAWEKLLSSILADHNYQKEIFITGSNSNLLSSELATYITGRYITQAIYPFSYEEFLHYHSLCRSKSSFMNYLSESHLPEMFLLKNENIKLNYMQNIKDSILLRDVVRRYKVQNVDLLEKLFLFLVGNIGGLFSINSIVTKLNLLGYDTNAHTIGNYVKYMEEAFILDGVSRFDIKGKRIFEGDKKYYLNDTGFKQYLFSDFNLELGKTLENYVYNYLKQNNYQVYTGKYSNWEVDFIANNNEERKYIQVTYLLASDDVLKREYGNLEKINDNWEKLVVSMDEIDIKPRNGIKHLKAWEL